MYKRSLTIPNYSFFLFGPRSTGKTTFLQENLPKNETLVFDLLLSDVLVELASNRGLFIQKVEASVCKWIFVDEIQKLPNLLDDIHYLIQKHKDRFKFVLSGSSARKLKRINGNLLAGRAIKKEFFPLTAYELGRDFNLDRALHFGLLPKVVIDKEFAIEILDTYTQTYITQEISQETLVKDIVPFIRFLKVAAIMNAQILNLSNISREAAVSRTTVERYFSILADTLIGTYLQAWQSKLKVKEVNHPKFYFFDTGVVRSILGYLRDPIERLELGYILETYILHELRAWNSYTNSGVEFFYWRTTSGKEVDFICKRGKVNIGIEVKASSQWKHSWSVGLRELLDAGLIKKAIGVYQGSEILQDGEVMVIPATDFSLALYQGLLF